MVPGHRRIDRTEFQEQAGLDAFYRITPDAKLSLSLNTDFAETEVDDRQMAELAIVENLQRKDLNPIEKALSFRRYLDEHQSPQEDLATSHECPPSMPLQ